MQFLQPDVAALTMHCRRVATYRYQRSSPLVYLLFIVGCTEGIVFFTRASVQGNTPDLTLTRESWWPKGKCPCIDPRLEHREWPPSGIALEKTSANKTTKQDASEKEPSFTKLLGAGAVGTVGLLLALGLGVASRRATQPPYATDETFYLAEDFSAMDFEPDTAEEQQRPTLVTVE